MENKVKICAKCKEEKEVDYFYYLKNRHGNFYHDTYCKKCRYANTLKNRHTTIANKRERRKNDPVWKEKERKLKRESFIRCYRQSMYSRCRYRSQIKGYDFNIEPSDIVIPEKCPILGITLIKGTKDNYMQSPSIDRIDNSKGYVKGNIQIISTKANSMKNSASREELLKFAKYILKTYK